MTIIQTAKDLLRKGIKLNDQELVVMANQLLDSLNIDSGDEANKQTPAVKVETKKTKTPATKKTKVTASAEIADQFKVQNKNSKQKRESVKVSGKENKFVDDGILAKDDDNITPNISLAKRERPKFQKVQQLCESCRNSVLVHPAHTREFYICDNCLANRSKGR